MTLLLGPRVYVLQPMNLRLHCLDASKSVMMFN